MNAYHKSQDLKLHGLSLRIKRYKLLAIYRLFKISCISIFSPENRLCLFVIKQKKKQIFSTESKDQKVKFKENLIFKSKI